MLYGLKQLLFKRMQNDMGVMSEHADNILELWEEIDGADNDILAEYAKTFLTTEDTAVILLEYWQNNDPYGYRDSVMDLMDGYRLALDNVTKLRKERIQIIRDDITENNDDPDFLEESQLVIDILS